jgi:NAD(P)H dehydrogenase (quinone)
MFGADGVHGEMDLMLRHMLRGTLGYAGFGVLPSFVGYHVPYIGDAERAAVLDRYDAYLTQLDALAPMAFPTLDDFDGDMRPRERAPQEAVQG